MSTDSPPSPDAAANIYEARLSEAQLALTEATRRWNRFGNIRLVLFALLAMAIWWGFQGNPPGWLLAGALTAALALLVVMHTRIRRERDRHSSRVVVNQQALARLRHAWDDLPPLTDDSVPLGHAYARDLDVLGRASILRRISTPVFHEGRAILRSWLLAPAPPDEIVQRQAAVAELAADLDLRQRVEALGAHGDASPANATPLIVWLTEPVTRLGQPWYLLIAVMGPVATLLLSAGWLLGIVSGPWFLAPVVINVAFFQIFGRRISDGVARITPALAAIERYRTAFGLIAGSQPETPRLVQLHEQLATTGAATCMTRLSRIASFAIPPGSLLWMPAQMFLLWDVHVLHALVRWRHQHGADVPGWFQALGEWEALAALSVLAHDHPEWSMPSVDSDQATVAASKLAHPLLQPGAAIANDVAVGPEGTFLFVTGSNMSGKSTLLRAIGANAVLAQAGAPVCAESLVMPPLDVWTCMRVEDSIDRGVSFFMAELERLKAVVDAAAGAAERPVLYLLDEILQGTNTAERQIASRRVLADLCRRRAIGAVSSHDLELVDDPDLANRAVAVHFEDHVEDHGSGPEMRFDYRLKPGVATSTNALALMRMLGFDVD